MIAKVSLPRAHLNRVALAFPLKILSEPRKRIKPDELIRALYARPREREGGVGISGFVNDTFTIDNGPLNWSDRGCRNSAC
jgi:hypothetical protein